MEKATMFTQLGDKIARISKCFLCPNNTPSKCDFFVFITLIITSAIFSFNALSTVRFANFPLNVHRVLDTVELVNKIST